MIRRRKPIERSALKPPTIEQVRAWQRKPRKALAKIGAKTKRERPALDAFRSALIARSHGYCEATTRLGDVLACIEVCGRPGFHMGIDPHHVWPEDHDRGVHDPERGLWLCRHSHDWAHAHPDQARRIGLLRAEATIRP